MKFQLKGNSSQCRDEDLHCKNGGYCELQAGQPKCICKPEFHGKNCQIKQGLNVTFDGMIIKPDKLDIDNNILASYN